MARLYSSGFELQSMTAGMEWDTITGSPTIDTTDPRSGAACLLISPSAAAQNVRHAIATSNIVGRTLFFRAYIKVTTRPGGLVTIMDFCSGATSRAALRMNSDGTLELWNATTSQIGSDSAALNNGQQYMLELKVVVDGSGVGRTVEAKIDGVVFATTTSASVGAFNSIRVGNVTSETWSARFDDIAVNDADGTAQNDYPGEGKIVHLYPNGDGDTQDTAEDHTDVDEKPTPDDNNTWANLATNGWVYEVTLENSSVADIGSGDAVTLVQVGIRETAASASSESWQLRIKSASGGTLLESATITHNDTTWRTNGDTNVTGYQLTSYTDPTTGLAWTPTGTNSLDNAQIGVEAIDAAPDIYVSSLWALVEYIPGSSPDVTVNVPVLGLTASLPTPTVTAQRNVTITASALSVVASLPTVTVSTASNALIPVAVQSLTLSLPDATVSTTRNVAVSSGVLSSVFSIPAITVSAERHVTVSASLLAATFSLPAPTVLVTGDVTVNAPTLSAVLSLPAASVTAARNITITPGALSATFSLPTLSVATERHVSISAGVLSATLSLPTPTFSAQQNVTVTASVLTATFSLPPASISTGVNATINVPVLSLTSSVPAVSVATERHVTVSATVLTATFSVPAATAAIASNVTVPVPALSLSLSVPTVSVQAVQQITVTPAVLGATFSLPTVSVSTVRNTTVTASLLAITASVPVASVSTSRNLTVPANVLGATFSLLPPTVLAYAHVTVQVGVFQLTFSLPAVTIRLAEKGLYKRRTVTYTYQSESYTRRTVTVRRRGTLYNKKETGLYTRR